MTAAHAIRVRTHTWLVLAVGSLAGLVMFLWPLFTSPPAGTAHSAEAPFIFVLILPVVIAVVLAELSSGGLDVKAIAMLGLLSGVGAALRPLGGGTAGIETVLFLLILAGRVYGPGFGFVLGSTTLFASAFLTGGVGPWLPFQMLAASWVGLGAGLLPRAKARAEIVMLAAYGAVAAYVFGFFLNMWFWPYTLGTFAGAGTDPGLQFVPGDAVISNLHRFFVFTLATSTFGWDTGRAITNVVAICLLGTPVLGRAAACPTTSRVSPGDLVRTSAHVALSFRPSAQQVPVSCASRSCASSPRTSTMAVSERSVDLDVHGSGRMRLRSATNTSLSRVHDSHTSTFIHPASCRKFVELSLPASQTRHEICRKVQIFPLSFIAPQRHVARILRHQLHPLSREGR